MYGIEWRDDLALGFSQIDEQHKQLIQTMSDLNQAIIERRTEGMLRDIFSRLFDYMNNHFALEESYFDQFEYPFAEQHKAAHAYFINSMHEKFSSLSTDTHTLSVELIGFLDLWLVGHIMVMDKQYEANFKEHGLK